VASAQGVATLNFGAYPGTNEASVAVTGQATISATSKAEAYIMGDDTTVDHDAADHRYGAALIGLSCGTPTASTGFTIYGRSVAGELTGLWSIRWVWAD